MWRALSVPARSTALVGVVALAVTGLGGPAQASRTVAESYPVPAGGTYTLTGHGFGHGHGMSQYGAQGAAKQGLTYRQILAFYYPGTTLGAASSGGGQIRVLISADTDGNTTVVTQPGLSVRDVASGATYALPTSGTTLWRLRSSGGATVLESYGSAWKAYLPGGKPLGAVAELYRAGSTVTLRVGTANKVYRGALRVDAGRTIDVVGMDDYVRGVVPREMPASWLPAAVQAQAVAARTYGAWDRAAHASRSYQTCDTTSCQVYGGVAAEDSRSNAAVSATAGQVLTYGGAPAFTQFGSSSGGWTSAGSMPYLVAKADPYDGVTGSTAHTWTTTLTAAAIQRKYPSLGTLRRIVVTQRDGNGEWYGRVEKLTLDGTKADVALTGSGFRSAFGLRSQWFRPNGGTTTPPPSTTPPAPTPPPDNAAVPPTTTQSAITARWTAIGGARSVLGRPTSGEWSAAGGRVQRFEHGRIYWKSRTGAHELYGRVLKTFLTRPRAAARLGFPTTRPTSFSRGVQARFEHGTVRVYRSGKVRISFSR